MSRRFGGFSINIDSGGILLAAFIVLKLTGYIDWSWWWVLSPLWVGFVVVLALLPFVLRRV